MSSLTDQLMAELAAFQAEVLAKHPPAPDDPNNTRLNSKCLTEIIIQKSADVRLSALVTKNPTVPEEVLKQQYPELKRARNVTRKFVSMQPVPATLKTECRQVTYNQSNYVSQVKKGRVLSFCIVNPTGEDECSALQLCFDVDEVRAWMANSENKNACNKSNLDTLKTCTFAQGAEDHPECKQGTECAMFGAEIIQNLIRQSKFTDTIEVPATMPREFQEAIENFEIVQTTKTALKQDPLAAIIRQAIENWIGAGVEKIEYGVGNVNEAMERIPGFGIFWWFTRKALTPFYRVTKGVFHATWRFSWWVSQNPFLIMLAATTLKCFRIAYCIYTTYPTLGKTLVKLLLDKIIGNLKGVGLGMLRYMVDFLLAALDCLDLILTADYTTFFTQCVQKIIDVPGAANAVRNFMKDSFLWILERSGFSTFAQQAKIGFSLPGSIIDVMWRATPDWELIKNMDLQLIFGQFQLRDWTETAVDFFLAHVPLDFATKCFVNLLSRVAPPLVPVFARMEALRIHPVQVVRFLQQSPSYLKYGREFLEELYTWVFEMSRCLFDYLAKMIKYYFGFEEAETSVAGTKDTLPCCMLQIMDDLQKWSKGETPAQRLQANVLRSFSDDRRQVTDDLTKIRLEKGADSPEFRTAYMNASATRYGPRPIRLEEVQVNLDAEIASLGLPDDAFGTARFATPAEWKLDELEKQAVTPTTPTEDIVSATQWVGRKWNSIWNYMDASVASGSSATQVAAAPSMLAVVTSDTKLSSDAFSTIVVNGTPVHFYLFVSDDGSVHIGVQTEDMERLFPGCVQWFRGSKFLLLHRLPPRVARQLVEGRAPVIDLFDLSSS